MKLFNYFILCTATLFISVNISAQSSKATAAVGDIGILDSAQMSWSTVMSSKIRTANAKDLFMNVALECGLYTKTQVKGKKGESDASMANAKVMVRVMIDGKEAKPGKIVFCERQQDLSAVLGGVLESCTDSNLDGTIEQDECEFSDEEIELVLKTMSANSFNFILDNLRSGEHLVEVQAKIDSGSSAQQGSADARATIGHGSVLIEEVRMIKDQVIDF